MSYVLVAGDGSPYDNRMLAVAGMTPGEPALSAKRSAFESLLSCQPMIKLQWLPRKTRRPR